MFTTTYRIVVTVIGVFMLFRDCYAVVHARNNFEAEVKTLQLVQVIFRHGDRAPTSQYPNDPVNENRYAWPEGFAQLTSVGKMQQYNLGQYLRNRYNGFLTNKYRADELYVMSSDMDRTIMSVESNLAGLYPPIHKWHPNLDWQPIPLRTIPWKDDKFLHYNHPCPKYDQLHRDFLRRSDVVKKFNQNNLDFVEYISSMSGIRGNTVKEIIHLQDIIFIEKSHNFTVPQWALDALPRLTALQAEINTWSTYTEHMKRLHGGPLLDLILKNMLSKIGVLKTTAEERRLIAGGGNRKMLMYSAHDSTLSRIMNTIGIFNPHLPPYASALMFELHWDPVNLENFVKIFYRNETTNGPYLMTVPGCDSRCTLTNLIELTKHLIPEDLDLECTETEETDQTISRRLKSNSPTVIPCATYTYPDPKYLAIIAVIVFLASIVTAVFMFKIIQCTAENRGGCDKNLWSSTKLFNSDVGRRYSYERI